MAGLANLLAKKREHQTGDRVDLFIQSEMPRIQNVDFSLGKVLLEGFPAR